MLGEEEEIALPVAQRGLPAGGQVHRRVDQVVRSETAGVEVHEPHGRRVAFRLPDESPRQSIPVDAVRRGEIDVQHERGHEPQQDR